MRKNYGKFENRLNYTEIVVLESKKRKHSEFMNKLKLRMILWSTAEAVLRHQNFCVMIIKNYEILWSTAEAVLRLYVWCHHNVLKDPMVYCGSGTETKFIAIILF